MRTKHEPGSVVIKGLVNINLRRHFCKRNKSEAGIRVICQLRVFEDGRFEANSKESQTNSSMLCVSNSRLSYYIIWSGVP